MWYKQDKQIWFQTTASHFKIWRDVVCTQVRGFAVLWFKGPCFWRLHAVSMASDSSDDESAADRADAHLPFVTAFGQARELKDAPWFQMMKCILL